MSSAPETRSSRPDESLDSTLFAAEAPSLADPLPIDGEAPDATPSSASPAVSLFGSIAVQERFLSEDQLAEALKIQKTSPAKPTLGRVLQDQGWLTALQVEVILDIQRVNSSERVVKPQEGGLFGHLAVGAGFCTTEQVHAAMEKQKELRAKGENVPVGRLLLEAGQLSREQVLEILRRQEKGAVRCDGCGATFLVEGLEPGTRFACCRCYRVLSIPTGSRAPTTTGTAFITHSPMEHGPAPAKPATAAAPAPAPAAGALDHLVLRHGGITWPLLYFALLMAAWSSLGRPARLSFAAVGMALLAVSLWGMTRDARRSGDARARDGALRGALGRVEDRWARLLWVWKQYGAWEKIGGMEPKELRETDEALREARRAADGESGPPHE